MRETRVSTALFSPMNFKHGLRSEKTILRDEDAAEFDALVNCWFNHYAPGDDEIGAALVAQLARAHWFLKRAVHRLEEIEYELPGNAHCWTADMEKRFANFLRYKTAAERSFLRFYKDVETYYRRLSKSTIPQVPALPPGADNRVGGADDCKGGADDRETSSAILPLNLGSKDHGHCWREMSGAIKRWLKPDAMVTTLPRAKYGLITARSA